MSSSAEDLTNWTQPVNLTLRSGPASVRTARRFTNDLLSRWGLATMRDDALLCLSELVSNAVVYAGSTVNLQVSRVGSQLRLEVTDGRPLDERFANIVRARQEDKAHHPMLLPIEGGRGLLLVDELAQEWGVVPLADQGKQVWCVLSADRPHLETQSPVDVTDSESADALLLGIPTRFLMAQERRVHSVLQALASSDRDSSQRRPLIEQISRTHRRHLEARLQPSIDVDSVAQHDRLDLAFDGSEDPYQSARDLAEALVAAETLVGIVAPTAGPSREDLSAFDQWYVDELGRQAAGQTPSPCPFPARAELRTL